jgi:putative ABC transport system ATP-binding protein
MLTLEKIQVGNVLKDLNLTVSESECVLVIGDNGAGKTTLFNTILGKIFPKKGRIKIQGEDVTSWPSHKRASMISYVFQDPRRGTLPHMTIRENILLAARRGQKRSFLYNSSRKQSASYREKLRLLDMNLENRLEDYPGDLSGGQRQALSIALSLLAEAKIWLLDEITASLDAKTSEKILRIVHDTIRAQKKTCLMITHDPRHRDQLGDRVMMLAQGKVHPTP